MCISVDYFSYLEKKIHNFWVSVSADIFFSNMHVYSILSCYERPYSFHLQAFSGLYKLDKENNRDQFISRLDYDDPDRYRPAVCELACINSFHALISSVVIF